MMGTWLSRRKEEARIWQTKGSSWPSCCAYGPLPLLLTTSALLSLPLYLVLILLFQHLPLVASGRQIPQKPWTGGNFPKTRGQLGVRKGRPLLECVDFFRAYMRNPTAPYAYTIPGFLHYYLTILLYYYFAALLLLLVSFPGTETAKPCSAIDSAA